MGRFNRDNRRERFSDGSRGNRFNRGGGRRDNERREMHQVTCDNCGKQCKVPFKPTGDKPVYCSDCFDKKGNSNRNESNDYSEQLDQINFKLDKIMLILQSLELDTGEEEEDEDNEYEEE